MIRSRSETPIIGDPLLRETTPDRFYIRVTTLALTSIAMTGDLGFPKCLSCPRKRMMPLHKP